MMHREGVNAQSRPFIHVSLFLYLFGLCRNTTYNGDYVCEKEKGVGGLQTKDFEEKNGQKRRWHVD